MRSPGRDGDRLRQGHRGWQEVDLGPRHENLADLPLARVENLADNVPLVRAQVLVPGDQITQLVAAHRAPADLRVAAEQPDYQVDRAADQPDRGPGQPRDAVEHRSADERDLLLPLQRDPLRTELTT